MTSKHRQHISDAIRQFILTEFINYHNQMYRMQVTETTPNKRSLKISKPKILANNMKKSYKTKNRTTTPLTVIRKMIYLVRIMYIEHTKHSLWAKFRTSHCGTYSNRRH
jgi:hypothetical protein